MCRFFESNKLLFSLVDPVNDVKDFTDNVQKPKIFLHEKLVEIKFLIDLVEKGLLMSVVNKLRCLTCFKKTEKKEIFCQKCKPVSILDKKKTYAATNTDRVKERAMLLSDVTNHLPNVKGPS